ncbi:MAG: DDE-type integrase/transposase/recombinase [Nanoarchaeota archaeon]|nr:DDE-type integrase/transposase/recombinase [Nanoarchaeota archaeon]
MKLNKSKIAYIIRKMNQEMSGYQIAKDLKLSSERVYQIYREYLKTGEAPVLKQTGRPIKILSETEINLILNSYSKYYVSASSLSPIIEKMYGIKINHNKIHEVLLENNMAKKEKKKSKRRKPWVRYEREHSLTAVHMDWLYDEQRGKNIIAVIDDASRMILAYGEFDRATVENTIFILKEASKYGKIKQIITDRGCQFTANKTDKKGEHKSQFAEFCKINGIKQILCRVKHPQSNGKIEMWFGLYRKKRKLFVSLQEFVYWYNYVKPHLSLNFEELETPVQAFRRKFKD